MLFILIIYSCYQWKTCCDFVPHFVVMSSLHFSSIRLQIAHVFFCVFSVDDDVSPSDEDPGNSAGKGGFNKQHIGIINLIRNV